MAGKERVDPEGTTMTMNFNILDNLVEVHSLIYGFFTASSSFAERVDIVKSLIMILKATWINAPWLITSSTVASRTEPAS